MITQMIMTQMHQISIFDLDECENYDLDSDFASMPRPLNYSVYLKSIGHERGRKQAVARNIVKRKQDFIRSLRYHSCFIWIACHQKIYPVHDNFDGYVCPWYVTD